MGARGRRGSRRLLLQALYQHQLTGHDGDELLRQFSARGEFAGIDADYFGLLLRQALQSIPQLDEQIARWADRPLEQMDPVERALLWIGLTELRCRQDVPVKVVINEAVELAKEFGAAESYRYVNGILDHAAKDREA